MSKNKPIVEETFNQIKKYLLSASVIDTAKATGYSRATVQNIKACEDYEDYLQWKADRRVNYPLLERSNIRDLSGEALFWEVHSVLKNIPIRLIRQKCSLTAEEIKAMKKASSYEEYLNAPLEEYKEVGDIVPKAAQQEICTWYRDGVKLQEIAEAYGISIKKVKRILDKELKTSSGSRKSRKSCKNLNPAIVEIILDGKEKRIPCSQIAKELGISIRSVYRADKSRAQYRSVVSKESFEYAQKRGIELAGRYEAPRAKDDFYSYSLRVILGKEEYPSWWGQKTKTEESMKNPKEAELANQWSFGVIKYGLQYEPVRTLAKRLGVSEEWLSTMESFDTWEDYKVKFKPRWSMKYDMTVWKSIQDPNKSKRIVANLPADFDYEAAKLPFKEYVLKQMFGNNLPDWGETKPEEPIEQSEDEKSEEIVEENKEAVQEVSPQVEPKLVESKADSGLGFWRGIVIWGMILLTIMILSSVAVSLITALK